MPNKLTRNIEDYLEKIVMVSNEKKVVRLKDISQMMSVSKASVHSALHILEDLGLIIHEKYGYIELTEKGRIEGERIYDAHKALIKFLTRVLKVDYKTAQKDACEMEHGISNVTLKRLISFMKFVETCPTMEEPDWIKSFNCYYKTGKRPKRCEISKIKQRR